jgi:hypothetical protein
MIQLSLGSKILAWETGGMDMELLGVVATLPEIVVSLEGAVDSLRMEQESQMAHLQLMKSWKFLIPLAFLQYHLFQCWPMMQL